jgi:hypothetical protein
VPNLYICDVIHHPRGPLIVHDSWQSDYATVHVKVNSGHIATGSLQHSAEQDNLEYVNYEHDNHSANKKHDAHRHACLPLVLLCFQQLLHALIYLCGNLHMPEQKLPLLSVHHNTHNKAAK